MTISVAFYALGENPVSPSHIQSKNRENGDRLEEFYAFFSSVQGDTFSSLQADARGQIPIILFVSFFTKILYLLLEIL